MSVPTDGHRPATSWVVRWWLLSRVLLLLAFAAESVARSDIGYYAYHLAGLPANGAAGTLREYPTPVLGLLVPLWEASASNVGAFHVVFAGAMLIVDAAFTWVLWSSTGRRPHPATVCWLLAVPLLGPVTLARFDLLPGVLAGAALLVLTRRPGWAGAFLAVGAGLKLWPVLLAPAVAARRWRVLVGGGAAGVALVVASLLAGGWDRLLSPLSFQGERGLQIESLPALPLMVAWVFDKQRWQVFYGQANSNEVTGPGAGALLTIATLLMLAMGLLLAALWVRAWRRTPSLQAVSWLSVATVALFLVTNKVFSPQYLLWLAPVVAAMLVTDQGRAARRVGILTVVACGLTHLVYPLLYTTVVNPGPFNGLGVGLLVARDVALLWLTVLAVHEAWRTTGSPALGDAGELADVEGLSAQTRIDSGGAQR